MIKKKILFVIPSLFGGGAERVLFYLISFMNPEKYDLYLVLLEKKGIYLSKMPSYVNVHDLNKKSRYDFLRLIIGLKALIDSIKPDIVMSFLSYTNFLSIVARFFTKEKPKMFISEHSHLSSDLSSGRMLWLKKILYARYYKFADICIVPSKGVGDDLNKSFDVPLEEIRVVRNPVHLEMIDELKREEVLDALPGKYIIGVGRLSEEKGFRYLLQAYAMISKDIDERLLIVGEGEQKTELKKIAEEYKIGKDVTFLGFQENPYKYMSRASAFVLSSLRESFGLVIVEAMQCETPVIAADCPCGPKEIITHEVDGMLVPMADACKLAETMLLVLRDKQLARKLVRNAKIRAKFFEIKNIVPQYESLFL